MGESGHRRKGVDSARKLALYQYMQFEEPKIMIKRRWIEENYVIP